MALKFGSLEGRDSQGKGPNHRIEQNLNDTNTTCIVVLLAVPIRGKVRKDTKKKIERKTMIKHKVNLGLDSAGHVIESSVREFDHEALPFLGCI